MSPVASALALLGLLAGVGLFVFVAGLAPDDGADSTSIAQGLALGAVVAAGPVAALTAGRRPSSVVALAGGMTIAGAATTPGGNLAGLVMALAGLVLLAGVPARPDLTWGLTVTTLGYTITLMIGMYAALSVGVGTAIALAIALAVACSLRVLARRSLHVRSSHRH